MIRLLGWSLGVALGLVGCTVPSLDELGVARVRVLINYDASFKKGCIKLQTQNVASGEVLVEDLFPTQGFSPPLEFLVHRRPGWPPQVKLVTTAHESANCSGLEVETQELQVDLGREGLRPEPLRVILATPDADGDGYVARVQGGGGTDCDDGSAARFPGNPETCDGLDNNCAAGVDEGLPTGEYFRDLDGDGVGAGNSALSCGPVGGFVAAGGDCDDNDNARTPGRPEVCDDKDNDCNSTVDEGFDKRWYRDGDGDGYGRNETPTVNCTTPAANYVHVTSNAFDCDDAIAEVNPGAVEKCNDRDDNCASGVDEGFTAGAQGKGASCANGVCGGTYVCNGAQDATACNAPTPANYYPDVDGDGQGSVSAAFVVVCEPTAPPPNHVRDNNVDCDDADPATRQGGTEVCDAVDNNCAGGVDENLSCGALVLVDDFRRGGSGHDWRTVAVGPGGLPVWIAGLNGRLIVRKTTGGVFQGFSYGVGGSDPADPNNCGNYDWYASWVRPSDGSVFLAGEGGRVSQHNGTVCLNQADASGTGHVTSMIGFESGGVTTIYLVSDMGRLAVWTPDNDPDAEAPADQQDTDSVYNAIHALNPNLLLVAGSSLGGSQHITSYVNGDLSFNTAHTLVPTSSGRVNALWMGGPTLAYAVGDGGVVWRWDGATAWTKLPPPASGTANFTSVVTLSSGDAYMVDSSANGQLHRRTPYGWAAGPKLPAFANKPLYGIAMSSERDFWVVGDDGYVFHFPEFP